jgi:hypothetical protein
MAISDEGIRKICVERLARWTDRLVEIHATPMVLVAIGHDHVSGRVSLHTLENLDNQQLIELLVKALENLDNQQVFFEVVLKAAKGI